MVFAEFLSKPILPVDLFFFFFFSVLQSLCSEFLGQFYIPKTCILNDGSQLGAPDDLKTCPFEAEYTLTTISHL